MTREKKKAAIIALCKDALDRKITLHTNAMNEEQETANKYKGAMESRYDTFKEEAQQRRDAHARQIDTLLRQRSALLSLNGQTPVLAGFGSVVETENEVIFICSAITDSEIEFEGKELITLRADTPLGLALAGKTTGDVAILNGREFRILYIY